MCYRDHYVSLNIMVIEKTHVKRFGSTDAKLVPMCQWH